VRLSAAGGFSAAFTFSLRGGASAACDGAGGGAPGEGLAFLLHRDPRGAAAAGAASPAACLGACGIAPSVGLRIDAHAGGALGGSLGLISGGLLGSEAGELPLPAALGGGLGRLASALTATLTYNASAASLA